MNTSLRIRKRSVITLILFPSFVFAALSGVMLYIWPPRGAIKKESFTLLGGDHHFWEDLHVMGGLLMITAVFFHLIMNWKMLVKHTVDVNPDTKKNFISKEVLIGMAFFVLILGSAVWNVFPETFIADLRQAIRKLW